MINISGKVIKGKSRGKKLGFPTANIKLNEQFEDGVYGGTTIIGNKKYRSAIYIKDNSLETHLLNFSGNLYDRTITVMVNKKIKDIMYFQNDEDLKQQIEKDIKLILPIPNSNRGSSK